MSNTAILRKPAEAGPDAAPATRRAQILEAARICFARSGFHGASMQEICAEAQMSPGALYRYFRSKDEMIEAIAEEERIRNARLLSALDGEGELCDRLIRVATAYLDDMRRPGAASLMAEVVAEGLRNSDVGERFLRNEFEVRERIGAVLGAQVASGAIAPIAPIEHALGFMCALVEGLVMRMALDPGLTPEVVEPMLREVARTVLRPAGPGPGVGRIEPSEPE